MSRNVDFQQKSNDVNFGSVYDAVVH